MRAVLTLFLALAPTVAAAQWMPPIDPGVTRWELTLFGGYRWGGDMDVAAAAGGEPVIRAELDHDAVRGVSLGAPLLADYHLELSWSSQETVLEGSTASGGIRLEEEMAIDVLHLSLVRTWRHQESLTSHLGFGAGVTRFEPEIEGFEREDRVSVSVLMGLKYPLMRHLAVRLDGRLLWLFDDDPLERGGGATELPAVIEPGNMLQYEVTLGLVGRF